MRRRFRKRPYRAPQDKAPFPAELRAINTAIRRRNYAEGLDRADRLLASSLSPHEQARALALVADSEYQRGYYAHAEQIYRRVTEFTEDHPTLWLRPSIGRVRSLLRDVQIDPAIKVARQTLALAISKWADFDEHVRTANAAVSQVGVARASVRPDRISVTATRLGRLLLDEGELEEAERCFEWAIAVNRRGACRARQGLATVALRMGDPYKAFALARDSIRLGKYRAKTIASWPLLIAARRKLGGHQISTRLLAGLEGTKASVRARCILVIVRELRASDMRQWREVAFDWLRREGDQFPIIQAEIRKLILASWKVTTETPRRKCRAAQHMLQTPGLSPNEWVAAAKERVRAGLWARENPNINALILSAGARYGTDFIPQVVHSLALSCMMAKRHDLARTLLQRNIKNAPEEDPAWGKSIWALARMESFLEDHAAAAKWYQRLIDATSVPLKFRLQAQIHWLNATIRSGHTEHVEQTTSRIRALANSLHDPDMIINLARQLRFSGGPLQELGREIFLRGEGLALKAFEDAVHPTRALDTLFRLTRRQVYDFGRCQNAIQLWESLNQDERDWLWTKKSQYWEYLGLLFEAYVRSRRFSDAESFARTVLQDPATPAEGLPHVGIPYGRWLIRRKRVADALALFEELLRETPTHPLCAYAYYWIALEAMSMGDRKTAHVLARRLRTSQGSKVGQLHEWDLDAKALLILADLNVGDVDPQAVNYSPERLERLKKQIRRHLAML